MRIKFLEEGTYKGYIKSYSTNVSEKNGAKYLNLTIITEVDGTNVSLYKGYCTDFGMNYSLVTLLKQINALNGTSAKLKYLLEYTFEFDVEYDDNGKICVGDLRLAESDE